MTDKKTIAIIGGTGSQGGGIAKELIKSDEFKIRLVVRDVESEKTKALLKDLPGAEAVKADLDDKESLVKAFTGAHGAFIVSNFWALLDVEKEKAQLKNAAEAVKEAKVHHVVVSVLEDTRKFPKSAEKLKPQVGDYLTPHFDAKGECIPLFDKEHTTFVQVAFYWENYLYFGLGPKKNGGDVAAYNIPLGGAPLPGVAVADIGKSIAGIFKAGDSTLGKTIGITGDVNTSEDIAAKSTAALGQEIKFNDIPFSTFAAFGFPGAGDLANMFEFQSIEAEYFAKARDPAETKKYNPDLMNFETWLAENKDKFKIE